MNDDTMVSLCGLHYINYTTTVFFRTDVPMYTCVANVALVLATVSKYHQRCLLQRQRHRHHCHHLVKREMCYSLNGGIIPVSIWCRYLFSTNFTSVLKTP